MQQVMTKPGAIEFREVATPIPAEDQVQIRMERIGICDSDIHVYYGKHPLMYWYEDYLDAICMVGEMSIKVMPLLLKYFPFRDYKAAYEYIDANREITMKVMIDVQA